MQKLTLDVDGLRVETFAPEAAAHASVGTVRGHLPLHLGGHRLLVHRGVLTAARARQRMGRRPRAGRHAARTPSTERRR